jgi:hypothetical protein
MINVAYPPECYPDAQIALSWDPAVDGPTPPWVRRTVAAYNEWAAANPGAAARLDHVYAFDAYAYAYAYADGRPYLDEPTADPESEADG